MKDRLKSVKDQLVILYPETSCSNPFTPTGRLSTDYILNNVDIILGMMTSHCKRQNLDCYLGSPSQAVRLSEG